MRQCSLILVACLTVFAACADARINPRELLHVADFDVNIQNNLDGYYNKFERGPSSASTFLDSTVYRGKAGRSLRVTVDRKDDGFCGVWLQFFNFRSKEKNYFDSTKYSYLSFWVRGEKGGEEFTVKLADKDWIEQEDSLPVGTIGEFLKGKVTTRWQEVVIPLKRFNLLDRTQLGGITLDFDTIGKHRVYIDDVAFKSKSYIPTPMTMKSKAPPVMGKSYPRAMWVWSVRELLLKPETQGTLFDFCKSENVDQLWLQIMYAFEPNINLADVPAAPPAEIKCILHFRDEMRQFLRKAHERGITVHVLDGYPEFAQKDYHVFPLGIVDAVIEFNKKSQPQERFDGIHFDNEPYLIAGARDKNQNKQILREFLELNAECQRRVRQHSDMVFGVDIPFFWHEGDPNTGEAMGAIEFNGEVKPASFHCIDMLDNVGIMNYRDTADGADGMIAHGMGILEYADTVDKAKVYMGIETFSYQPTDVWFAVGLPREVYADLIQRDEEVRQYAQFSRIDGLRMQIYDDGTYIHVGVEIPLELTPDRKKEIKATMAKLAQRFGASAYPKLKGQADNIYGHIHDKLRRDVEWTNPRVRDIIDPVNRTKYAGIVATSIMLPKVTFAQETYEEIQTQVGAAEEFFSRYKSYAGIAVHYYKTYLAIKKDAEK